MSMRDRVRRYAADFARRNALGPLHQNAVPEPGDLLEFPEDHSYYPPALLAFGPEPAIRAGWVRVGKYSSINSTTRILLGGGHHPEWISTYPFRLRYGLPGALEDGQPSSRGPIRIGNDVWIAYGCIIQSGVTIGDGAVVATGSVVVKNVEPYAIVGGNPAQHIRYRFSEATIAALQRIRWWEWPDEKVLAVVDQLNGGDMEQFLRDHDPGV